MPDSPSAAVFLDRDGVIVDDLGYASGRGQIRLVPGVARAIAEWNRQGRRVVMVTNQSGIGRGRFTRAAYGEFQSDLLGALARESAWIDHVEMCPHAPEAGCACRKPRPGMISAACIRLRLDPAHSIMIGDRETDLQAGRAAGVRALLYAAPRDFYDWVTEAGLLAPV